MAGILVVLVAAFVFAQTRPGTLLVLATSRSAQSVPGMEIQIHSQSWQRVGSLRPTSVPKAPATVTVLSVTLPAGRYDGVRVGSDLALANIQLESQVVEPVLLSFDGGRLSSAGVYAGNDQVNLGLSEQAGNLTSLPPFLLQDQAGRPLTNDDLAGHEVVVAAFHTTCRETCPIYTGLFLQLRKQVPPGTILLEATTDPEHDTPAVLKEYADRLGADWRFATGTTEQVERFWSTFEVSLAPGDAHVSTLALVDGHGFVRIVYRGVPHVSALPPALEAQLSDQGRQEYRGGGEGWGSAQLTDALHTIDGMAAQGQAAGGAAPAFTMTTLGGQKVSLDQYRGQPLVINFWASWCPACASEMPLIESSAARHRGIQLLLVDYRDDPAAARSFLARASVHTISALDQDGSVGDRYHVRGLPVTVFVRPDGSIEGTYTGELNQAVLDAHMADLAGR